MLNAVDDIVRTRKFADFVHATAHHEVCEKVRRRLLGAQPHDFGVTEAEIGKVRNVDFFLAALKRVLDRLNIAGHGLIVERNVRLIHAVEVRDLSQLNSQFLSALALDFQSYRAGVILAEIVDIRIRLTLKDGYGLDFAVNGNRRRGANAFFAFVRGYGKGLAPCRIVEAGRVPAVRFFSRVIAFARAQAVEPYGRGTPLKAAVRLEQQLAVRFDGDGELRSRAERVFVEIPHARVLVLHAVAEH